jgi:hypothetical protein
MNSTTDARRNNPAGSPASTRELLHQTRDRITAAESSIAALRAEQTEQLTTALSTGATVREVVEASGVSRAYLHRAGLPLYAGSTQATRSVDRASEIPKRTAKRAAALTRSGEIRDQIAQLKTEAAEAKGKRVDQVTQLRALDVDQATIADDAGVSAEWIRRISKARL